MKIARTTGRAGAALGALAIVLSGVNIAHADTSSGSGPEDAPASSSETARAPRPGPLSGLGLDRGQLEAVKEVLDAHRASSEAPRKPVMDLSPLVESGTLTQEQADAIAVPGTRLRDLVKSGTITARQVRAVKDLARAQKAKNREEQMTAVKASIREALSGLVSDGTITSEQADAIASAAHPGKRPGKGHDGRPDGGGGTAPSSPEVGTDSAS